MICEVKYNTHLLQGLIVISICTKILFACVNFKFPLYQVQCSWKHSTKGVKYLCPTLDKYYIVYKWSKHEEVWTANPKCLLLSPLTSVYVIAEYHYLSLI